MIHALHVWEELTVQPQAGWDCFVEAQWHWKVGIVDSGRQTWSPNWRRQLKLTLIYAAVKHFG